MGHADLHLPRADAVAAEQGVNLLDLRQAPRGGLWVMAVT